MARRPTSTLRPFFELLDAEFDGWQEYYWAERGERGTLALADATARTRSFASTLARRHGLDPEFLWHAYLSWQAHWVAFAQGQTEVEPNVSQKLGHLPSVAKLERMSVKHPELERFIVPLEDAALSGEISPVLYRDLMEHLRAIERQKFTEKLALTLRVREARRRATTTPRPRKR